MQQPEEEPAARRAPSWVVGMAAAIAAVLVIVAIEVPGRNGDGGRGRIATLPEPEPISAVEVRARMAEAFSSVTTLRGEITVTCTVEYYSCSPAKGGTRRWSFLAAAAGDERVTGIDHVDDVAYRPSTGVQREVHDFGRGPEYFEFTGQAAGPPDAFVGSPVLRHQLGSVVRAFLDDQTDVPVTEVTEDGLPVWRLSAPVTPNKLAGPGRSPDRLDIAVEPGGGFPLRITATLGGNRLYEIRLSKGVIDSTVNPSELTIAFPGPVISGTDRGFRRVPLDQVAGTVGYQPLVPRDLPAGYRLAEVTVARTGPPTGTEASNPPAADVVSMVFRRGFDRIVVSSRATGPDRSAWSDPLASGEGIRDVPEPFTVPSGRLAGAAAELVVNFTSQPHVWTIDDRLVVTVGGDATADELRRIVASF